VNELVFEVEHVDYAYPGGAPALRDISFEVSAGERLAILGANASGKSTLLHLLDGLYFATAGSVVAFGAVLTEESVETPPFSRRFRRRVGFLFQNSDAQLFNARVEEELAFGPLQLGLEPQEVQRRVDDMLRMLGIEHLRDRSPQRLSGGEKKKVALGSLLTVGPRVLLLDEPSSGLDPRSQQWLVEFLEVLHSRGVTLVTASHDLALVREVAERALVLSEDHRVVFDGGAPDALGDLGLLLSVNLVHAHAHVHAAGAPDDGRVHVHPHRHDAGHEHPHG